MQKRPFAALAAVCLLFAACTAPAPTAGADLDGTSGAASSQTEADRRAFSDGQNPGFDAFLTAYNANAAEFDAPQLLMSDFGREASAAPIPGEPNNRANIFTVTQSNSNVYQSVESKNGMLLQYYQDYDKLSYAGTPDNLYAALDQIGAMIAATAPDLPPGKIRVATAEWAGLYRNLPHGQDHSARFYGDFLYLFSCKNGVVIFDILLRGGGAGTSSRALFRYEHWTDIGSSLNIYYADLDFDGTNEIISVSNHHNMDLISTRLYEVEETGVIPLGFFMSGITVHNLLNKAAILWDGSGAQPPWETRPVIPYYRGANGEPVLIQLFGDHHNHQDPLYTMEVSMADWRSTVRFLRNEIFYEDPHDTRWYSFNSAYPYSHDLLTAYYRLLNDEAGMAASGFVPLTQAEYDSAYQKYLEQHPQEGEIPYEYGFSVDLGGSITDPNGKYYPLCDFYGNALADEELNALISDLVTATYVEFPR